MVRLLQLTALAATLAMTMTTSAGAAREGLVRNGDFEAGGTPRSWLSVGPGAGVAGWHVRYGIVDLVGRYWRAYDGETSLEVGTPGVAAIEQRVSTVPGRRYVLRFALAGNPDGPPRRKRLDVRAGRTTRRFVFDTAGRTRNAMGWIAERLPFTANSTATTIRFSRTDGGPTAWWGPVIDGVSVVEAAVAHAPRPRPHASPPIFGWGCPDC